MNIGNVYQRLGDYEKALFHLQKALAIQEVALGPSHADVARTKWNIGLVYQQLGNLAQARSCFEEAHTMFETSLGPDHPDTKKAAHRLEQLGRPCSCCTVS